METEKPRLDTSEDSARERQPEEEKRNDGRFRKAGKQEPVENKPEEEAREVDQ
jgi:hypothetical protein